MLLKKEKLRKVIKDWLRLILIILYFFLSYFFSKWSLKYFFQKSYMLNKKITCKKNKKAYCLQNCKYITKKNTVFL